MIYGTQCNVNNKKQPPKIGKLTTEICHIKKNVQKSPEEFDFIHVVCVGGVGGGKTLLIHNHTNREKFQLALSSWSVYMFRGVELLRLCSSSSVETRIPESPNMAPPSWGRTGSGSPCKS